MPDGYTGIRNMIMNHLSDMGEVADAVVDEIYLSVARHLEVDSIDDDLCAEGVYLRLDGITVGRRRLNDTEVTGSDERELEGTRNGCSRHCQGIDIGLHLTEFLLGRDAELLFLVDNEKAKILELHRLANEFVRTYYNIYLTFRQVVQQGRRLFACSGTCQIIHPYWHIL